jgi:hypothetical protein
MKERVKEQLIFWLLTALFVFFIISCYIMLEHDLIVYAWEHLIFAIITALVIRKNINS